MYPHNKSIFFTASKTGKQWQKDLVKLIIGAGRLLKEHAFLLV